MAIYDLSYIGTSANRIYFNDYNNDYADNGIIYRIKARAPQQRQIRDLDIPIPFESGISDFETLVGKTAYVIDGTMYPDGESTSDDGLAALRKVASLEVQQDDNLSDNGYVPYVWTEFSQQKQVFLKVLYVQLVETTQRGLVQDFRLICKIKDPTIHSATLKTADTSEADPTTASGTAIFPFTLPIVFGASTYSVSSDANNAGSIAAYPQAITIVGPVNRPRLTNTTTGEYIEVDVNLATASNVLRLAYDKDTFRVEQDGNSVISSVSTASTFFKIQPGGNVLELTGSSISSGAYATLTFYDAYPLS